ncbi:MAG TPA: histidine kinase [Actinoplanes sp.]
MLRQRSAKSWLLVVSLPAGAVALGLVFLHESVSEGDGAPVAVEAVAAALAVLGLVLFRRTRPVALALVLLPAGMLLAMPMGAFPFALFAVGLRRPARFAVTFAAVHVAAIAVIYGVAMGLTREYRSVVVFLALLDVSVVAVALVIRAQRHLVESWAERARQAEDGQRLRVEQARSAERERIAREMHDVLAHRISLVAVHAGALEVRRDARPAEREAAAVIRECAHDALEDLREVIGMLRAPGPDGAADRPQPTLGDVPALVDESRAAGAEVGLSVAGGDGAPEQVGRHAYRIVQEALTNARKHAPGAPVRVTISGGADRGLTVEVGNGLAPGGSIPGSGAGLAGLHERVRMAGGRLEHGPTPAGEFRLRAWLPWRA